MLDKQFLQNRLDQYTETDSDGELILKDGFTLNTTTRILTKAIKLGVLSYYLANDVWVYGVTSNSSKPNSIDSRFLTARRLTHD